MPRCVLRRLNAEIESLRSTNAELRRQHEKQLELDSCQQQQIKQLQSDEAKLLDEHRREMSKVREQGEAKIRKLEYEKKSLESKLTKVLHDLAAVIIICTVGSWNCYLWTPCRRFLWH